jgi:RNA polymerase sigma-70 factor (ECF subfamily)
LFSGIFGFFVVKMVYRKQHIISEETLVELLRARDSKGMNILYDNYSAALFGVILRIVENREIAEDILQEGFVKIWNNFQSYDSSKGRLFTWMINICRNQALDKLRSKAEMNSSKNQSLDNAVNMIDGSANFKNNVDTIGIKELTEKLEEEQKVIIDLLYFKGFTQAEAAEKLNIPLGTVKTRSRMAILKLREYFQ